MCLPPRANRAVRPVAVATSTSATSQPAAAEVKKEEMMLAPLDLPCLAPLDFSACGLPLAAADGASPIAAVPASPSSWETELLYQISGASDSASQSSDAAGAEDQFLSFMDAVCPQTASVVVPALPAMMGFWPEQFVVPEFPVHIATPVVPEPVSAVATSTAMCIKTDESEEDEEIRELKPSDELQRLRETNRIAAQRHRDRKREQARQERRRLDFLNQNNAELRAEMQQCQKELAALKQAVRAKYVGASWLRAQAR